MTGGESAAFYFLNNIQGEPVKLSTIAMSFVVGLYRGTVALTLARDNRKRTDRLERVVDYQRRRIAYLDYKISQIGRPSKREIRREVMAIKPSRN